MLTFWRNETVMLVISLEKIRSGDAYEETIRQFSELGSCRLCGCCGTKALKCKRGLLRRGIVCSDSSAGFIERGHYFFVAGSHIVP
jgi:hypothetical protein